MCFMLQEISRRRFLESSGRGIGAGIVTVLLGSCGQYEVGENPKESVQIARTAQREVSPTATLPPPQPAAVSEKRRISAEMVNLREHLAAEIAKYQGRIGISITDTQSGESINVNGQRAQLPGCVANLPCALTVVSELARGNAPFTKSEIEPYLLIMVRNSDPHAGLRVVEALGSGNIAKGVDKINRQMEEWTMFGSLYDHPPVYGDRYSVKGENNFIVPNEMGKVLTRLATGGLFRKDNNFDWNNYALRVMANNKVGLNFMIPGEIPESEATVYHKVGWFYGNPNTINDAGVIKAQDGGFIYSVVAMYENYETTIDEESLFYGPGFFLRKLSKITYDTFTQKYGSFR